MPDTYTSTASTNFDKSVVAAIRAKLDNLLRAGLAYTPAGSVIGAQLMPGNNGVFRSFQVNDLSEDGAVSIEDGEPDPTIEDLDTDYIEFTGTAKARSVGITDNAKARSPFNLFATAAERVGRDIAVTVDNVARALYGTGGVADFYGGSANTMDGDVAAGDVMTALLLKQGVATLRQANVKPLASGLFAFVADPLVIHDLMLDTAFVNEIRYADPGSLLTGEVARYGGASIIDAGSRGINHAGVGTGDIDVHWGTLIGQDAIFAALGGLHIIPVTGADHGDPVNRRDIVSWKGFLGGVINDKPPVLGDNPVPRFKTIGVATSLSA